MMYDHGFWGMGWGWLFWLIVIGAVLWLVVLRLRNSRNSSRDGESAAEILKQRYARGEISREEYDQKLRDMRRR